MPACGDVCASGCQYSTVQAAIDAVADGGTATIRICAGTYTRETGDEPVASINGKNVTLIGAGAGSGGTVLDGGQAATPNEVVSCQETTSELRHLSVTGANGGNAISNVVGNLTLDDVTVTGNTNTAEELGGAIFNDQTLILNAGAHVIGNTATSSSTGGGGIFTNGGSVTLNTGSRVSSNDAPNGNGGGIYNAGSMLTLNSGCEVTGNTAAMDGGGIYNAGTVVIDPGADLSNNFAPPGNPNDCIDAGGGMGCPS